MFSFRNNRANKDNRIWVRLTDADWDYLDHLANKHEDFNLSNIIRRLLSSCQDLSCIGFDLYEKSTIAELKDK